MTDSAVGDAVDDTKPNLFLPDFDLSDQWGPVSRVSWMQ